jgi:hypothetical protein
MLPHEIIRKLHLLVALVVVALLAASAGTSFAERGRGNHSGQPSKQEYKTEAKAEAKAEAKTEVRTVGHSYRAPAQDSQRVESGSQAATAGRSFPGHAYPRQNETTPSVGQQTVQVSGHAYPRPTPQAMQPQSKATPEQRSYGDGGQAEGNRSTTVGHAYPRNGYSPPAQPEQKASAPDDQPRVSNGHAYPRPKIFPGQSVGSDQTSNTKQDVDRRGRNDRNDDQQGRDDRDRRDGREGRDGRDGRGNGSDRDNREGGNQSYRIRPDVSKYHHPVVRPPSDHRSQWPANYKPPVHRDGFFYYSNRYANRPLHFGFWYFGGYNPEFCRRSVYFHFGYFPYVHIERVWVGPYVYVSYSPGPVIVDGGYYLNRTRGLALEYAMSDIRKAWTDGRFDLLKNHVRSYDKISVLLDGKYDYSLDANDYLDMTSDAIDQIKTIGFTWLSTREREDGQYTAFGRHDYRDADGLPKSSYVSYTLDPEGGVCYITEVGSSDSPLN